MSPIDPIRRIDRLDSMRRWPSREEREQPAQREPEQPADEPLEDEPDDGLPHLDVRA